MRILKFVFQYVYVSRAFLSCVEASHHGQFKCPESRKICTCKNFRNGEASTADCSNKNLSKIPHFEEHYNKFIFSRNKLYNVTDITFEPVASPWLVELVVSFCDIEYVTKSAFKKIPSLSVLDISYNQDLKISYFTLSLNGTNITYLDLSGIKVEEFFSQDIFLQNLEVLIIKSCQLYKIKPSMFQQFTNLKELDISYNTVTNIDDALLIKNKMFGNLTATYCDLKKMPLPKKISLVKKLDISNNFIEKPGTLFKYGHNFPYLTELIINSNPLKELPACTFKTLLSLQLLSLSNITTKTVTFRGITSNSLMIFDISNSIFLSKDYPNVFENSSNITNLTMSGINLTDWGDSTFSALFQPLYDVLEILILQNTSLKELPNSAIRNFSKLQRLDLSHNHLSHWHENTFPNINISKLKLNNNNIRILNKTSFPELLWRHVRLLDVTKNPFACTCDIHWFRGWMRGQYFKLASTFGTDLKCNSPPEHLETNLVDFDPAYEDCFPLSDSMIVATVTCAICVVLIFVLNCFVKVDEDKEHIW